MNRAIVVGFLLIAGLAVSEASVGQQLAKEGERVEIETFKGVKSIQRTVPAGTQIFHFEGPNKGSFVDGKGKKINSSNYEIKNGHLVIKKFTKADAGQYTEYPTKVIGDKHGSVLGPTLVISLSK